MNNVFTITLEAKINFINTYFLNGAPLGRRGIWSEEANCTATYQNCTFWILAPSEALVTSFQFLMHNGEGLAKEKKYPTFYGRIHLVHLWTTGKLRTTHP